MLTFFKIIPSVRRNPSVNRNSISLQTIKKGKENQVNLHRVNAGREMLSTIAGGEMLRTIILQGSPPKAVTP